MLYIFSGLPGSGKTTLAKKLAEKNKATYINIDAIQDTFLKSECNVHIAKKTDFIARWALARETGHALAYENLKLGNNVIADSINPGPITRQKWRNAAINTNVKFIEIFIFCSDADTHKSRIDARENNNNFWQRVQNQKYDSWPPETIYIDTAYLSIDQSFEELCNKLSLKA